MIAESFLYERPCGCYHETSVDEEGFTCLITARTCSTCFDQFLTFLEREVDSVNDQLTLSLASQPRAPRSST